MKMQSLSHLLANLSEKKSILKKKKKINLSGVFKLYQEGEKISQ